ncbi:hypothetical protein ATY41_10565 [Leifsonia xyli subsp. xyli]|uniref:Uncharacterized protein n=1 Tax=Leifsonia xyli subsp. xyli TaxID=59736 RepID=A0A1E2SK84_LEIXY|nr:hypothetical protein [Leifsonia xyli]ODA90266.1 hypothetical protein ATY41_10565 [Leifsonia xyli subsp. xyli]
MLSKPPKVAATLAKAVVSRLARPSRDTLATALATIRATGDAGNWRAFTRALFDSWVAVECEATSRFNTKVVDAAIEAERTAARRSAALAWPELVQQAASLDGHPFGHSPREVADFIRGIVTDLL